MSLAPFTTNDEVRATCGISDEDVNDPTLNLEVYARALFYEFDQIDVGIKPAFETIEAIAGNARTAPQQKLFDAVKLFAPYAVGNNIVGSLALAAPKGISDGKALISRFSESPFEALSRKLQAGYEKFRDNLADAYKAYLGTGSNAYVLPNFMLVSSPNTDRVTG